MGATYVNVTVVNPIDPSRVTKKKVLIDTGAFYTVIPGRLLRSIGIKPYGKKEFTLADGSSIVREVGSAFLRINGEEAPTPVIFGEKKDGSLLGVIALESLGLSINPRTGELQRVPLLLM